VDAQRHFAKRALSNQLSVLVELKRCRWNLLVLFDVELVELDELFACSNVELIVLKLVFVRNQEVDNLFCSSPRCFALGYKRFVGTATSAVLRLFGLFKLRCFLLQEAVAGASLLLGRLHNNFLNWCVLLRPCPLGHIRLAHRYSSIVLVLSLFDFMRHVGCIACAFNDATVVSSFLLRLVLDDCVHLERVVG